MAAWGGSLQVEASGGENETGRYAQSTACCRGCNHAPNSAPCPGGPDAGYSLSRHLLTRKWPRSCRERPPWRSGLAERHGGRFLHPKLTNSGAIMIRETPMTRFLWSAAIILLLTSITRAADQPATEYRVGMARIDITPKHPVRLNGFGSRRTESEGVTQRIWASALAIDDGSKSPALLITVDILGIPSEIRDELARRLDARKLGVTKERLAIM